MPRTTAASIYDLALRRALIGIGEDMVNVAFDATVEDTPKAQIEEAEKRLFELAEKGRTTAASSAFETALVNAIDMASAAYKRDGHLSGLATGLTDLDRLMGGLQPSDLIILAGRPGMGKTALATNIAFNVAQAWRGEVQPDGEIKTVDGGIVGFFSLEMSSEQLATRIIACGVRTFLPPSRAARASARQALPAELRLGKPLSADLSRRSSRSERRRTIV